MKKGYGLVLAGGGTKGAYEVGAWKALKELNVNIEAIVGTSIGAINGALFLQDDYNKILELYDNIKFEDLVKISEANKLNEGNIFSRENIVKFTKEFTKNKGLENTPMKNLMEKYIDIEKIYSSSIDYGIVTTSIDLKNKSLEIFKEEIEKEKLYEYILASACFPIFKPQKIGNGQYLDGGMYDNVPVNMLLNKGYENIIVIDISNNGISRRVQNKNAYIKIIKPNEELGSIFDFDKNRIRKNIIRKLTVDHSYVEKLVKDGTITREESYNHPKKNMLMKALGCTPYVEPDVCVKGFLKEDVLLMASDGLTNMIKDKEIYTIIKQDVEKASGELVDMANNLGGYDNITVVVIEND